MANKKNISSLEALTNTFHELYKEDSTLDYLTKFEEDRKQLLGLKQDSSLFQAQAEEMKKILASPITQSAFSTIENYEKYTNLILSTIEKHDYSALKDLAVSPISSFLNNDYSSALKATELLSDSINNAHLIGLAGNKLYNNQLSDSIGKYLNNNKIEASQGLLNLASTINTDLFKTKISKSKGLENAFTPTGLGLGSLSSATSAFDLAGLSSRSKGLENAFTPTATGLGLSSTSLKDTMKDLYSLEDTVKSFSIDNISITPPINFKPIELPRVQDSPMYKQNEKLIDKSEKQIEAIKEMSKYLIKLGENQGIEADKLNEQNNKLLSNSHEQTKLMAEVSSFLSSQSIILELQRENQETQANQLNELNSELLNNSYEQIKLMAEVSSFLASQSAILEVQKENQELQNKNMAEQIRDNKSSSKIAFIIALASIIIGIISAGGSMYLEHHIYKKEDTSDNKNHIELKKVIKENNIKNTYKEIIQQLVLQNKNQHSINQNLKIQAIENREINKQLLKQLKILNQKNLDFKQTIQKRE